MENTKLQKKQTHCISQLFPITKLTKAHQDCGQRFPICDTKKQRRYMSHVIRQFSMSKFLWAKPELISYSSKKTRVSCLIALV